MYVPPHISEKAQQQLQLLQETAPFDVPTPDDLATWNAIRTAMHEEGIADIKALNFEYQLKDTTIGGVPCVWMETPRTNNNFKVLLYIHGGVFCLSSPREAAVIPLQIAHESGIKVLAVDYRLAPEHPYPAGLDDVIAVYKDLLDQGYSTAHIAWFGDSAGGGLTASGMMRLKAEQIPLPAAIGMLYPWVDLMGTGDSFHLLADKDPVLFNQQFLSGFVKAYCNGKDPNDPFISPINGDFGGFPPTLIQVGTKEILLSDAIRLYRKAKDAGGIITLDIFEGMWHGFHYVPDLPEGQQACKEMAAFLNYHIFS